MNRFLLLIILWSDAIFIRRHNNKVNTTHYTYKTCTLKNASWTY